MVCPACHEPFYVTLLSTGSASSNSGSQKTAAQATEDEQALKALGKKTRSNAPPSKPLGQLGRFVVECVLGEGSFGRVYRAFDPQLDRLIALKVPTFSNGDQVRVARFLAEAKAAAQLRHPHIVPIFESGRAGGRYFIAAQYIAGQPLSARIQADTPSLEQTARWVLTLAEAFAYAHRKGIVHRDIKPDNIMLDAKGEPQVMDFGLAKRESDLAMATGDGSVLGTPAYMSPEQARGETKDVGPLSDQYSLGVVLYELLSGQRPFSGTPHSVIAQVINQEPPSPREIKPSVPADLNAICQKAMTKEMSGRYADMDALAADLRAWLNGEPVTARPIRPHQRLFRWARRNPVLARSVAVASAALLAAATISVLFAVSQYRIQNELAKQNRQLERQKQQAETERQIAETQTTRARNKTRAADSKAQEAQEALEEMQRQERDADAASKLALDALNLTKEEAKKAKEALSSLQTEIANRQEVEGAVAAAEKTTATTVSRRDAAVFNMRLDDYGQTLQDALAAMNEGNHSEANRLLQCCPDDLRGWEADFLGSMVQDSRHACTIRPLTGEPLAINFSSNSHNLACTSKRWFDKYSPNSASPSQLALWDLQRDLIAQHLGSYQEDYLGKTRGTTVVVAPNGRTIATSYPGNGRGQGGEWKVSGRYITPVNPQRTRNMDMTSPTTKKEY